MAPFTIRWGIVATGGISHSFGRDLVKNADLRKATDIHHVVTGVGSRSSASADKFIHELFEGTDSINAKAYDSYEGVYNAEDVDAIYVGTPHSFHYENCLGALNGGKHVLCEKPFTFDVAELEELVALAKKKNLFLMEAVWTRFQPIAYEIQDIVFSKKYGTIKRFYADLSVNFKPESLPESHRMIDPNLAGGSILDLGPYPMVWAMLLVHQHPDNKGKPPSKVLGTMDLYKNGVDSSADWLIQWDNVCTAHCSTSMSLTGRRIGVIVEMETADLVIDFPPYRPSTYSIYSKYADRYLDQAKGPLDEPIHRSNPPPEGVQGISYQADEVARCIRDGKIESERCSLTESLIVQGIFDEVRKQGGYVVKHGKASQ